MRLTVTTPCTYEQGRLTRYTWIRASVHGGDWEAPACSDLDLLVFDEAWMANP